MQFWGKLMARVALAVILFASGVAYEAPHLILVSVPVAVSAVMLSVRRYRKHVLARNGRKGIRRRELEERLAAVEELQERRGLDFEDQYNLRLAELEERMDFTERLLTTQRETEGMPTPV